MVEIRSIAGRMNAAGAERLTDGLTHLFQTGTDLGPRGPQINSLGLSLNTLAEEMRAQLAEIDTLFVNAGLPSSGHPCTHALLAEIENIADLARRYRPRQPH